MISDRVNETRVIRTALPTDAQAITDLHFRARSTYYPDGVPDDGTDWPAAWQGVIVRPHAEVLCLIEQDHIVAVASFRTPDEAPPETVKLFQFHVDPHHWREGLGTALHRACVDRWRADARQTAVLEVHVDNERAQAFYTRQGWVAAPPDGGHHLPMTLPLTT
ncbi:GNAT family N-acetyltransferase [Streptomyces sp. NPDC088350]|uniref:GNAT family N-acetyltransferase n=1 Tax=Streptomyces sp. NPDC088350 TaxID=3365854 RepID=UPI003822E40C